MRYVLARGAPIYQQLRLEEALFRADRGSWCIVNMPPSAGVGDDNTRRDVSSMTVKILKEELKKAGLTTTGKKAVLVERLMENSSSSGMMQQHDGDVPAIVMGVSGKVTSSSSLHMILTSHTTMYSACHGLTTPLRRYTSTSTSPCAVSVKSLSYVGTQGAELLWQTGTRCL